jgi:hypothetical protein
MALQPLEIMQFGGVDSRSNPLSFPTNRTLRCRNFVPKDSGIMELRYGFTTVTMTGSTSTASYHSVIPYTLYNNAGVETPYLLLGQGTQLRVMNITTGAVSLLSPRGAALTSTTGFNSYLGNGKIHFGNGADQKWFDGTTVRDNGLRSLTTAEIANIVISFGIGEMTTANNASITLTATGSTGTFPATSGNGLLFYVSLFDPTTNELGPATTNAGSGRVTVAATNKVTVGGLPDFSIPLPTIKKLISRTGDSLANAFFCTDTSTAITSCSRTSTTLTVISPTHGLSSGDVVVLSGTTNFDSIYSVTVTDANTFTVTLFLAVGQNTTGANTTGGTCKRVKTAASGTTSIDITSPAQDSTIVVNDANRGVAATSTSSVTQGYQIYGCIYNPNGGGHVGNRVAIGGGRFTLNIASANRVNIRITGLPDLSGTDSEWSIMIGRTGDAAQLPYSCTDSNGNFFFTVSGQTAITLTTQGALFGSSEMPTRNGVIPAALNMFARVNDRIHGGQTGRPTVYRSASEADALNGDFVGRPEQSWAPTDIDTFPTSEGLTGMFAEDRGAFYGTKNDGAVFADLGQGFAWLGPWYGAGMAGTRSWCYTPYGIFWVTGHKQLATMNNGSPVAVSDEYQAALLARIGDANLSKVEMAHLTDAAKGINKITMKCLDSSGVPFEVFHDFRNKDERSPYGQGYDAAYSAPLATNFILSKVRDANGAERLWAGASSGAIYQLEDGANDAGTEFTGDALFPVSAGPGRSSLPEIRIFGDSNVTMAISNRLDKGLTEFTQLAQEAVAGEEGNSYYKYKQTTTKFNKGYLRMQLTSHSADGNLDLNDPPHCPLETYGRIYLGQGLVGSQQGI